MNGLSETLPREWNKIRMILPLVAAVCWFATRWLAADQENPLDLLKIGFPITAGLTTRSIVSPIINYWAEYKAGIENLALLDTKGGGHAV